ncbi:hypothetical protein B0H14DRAFT_2629217 [Mycena olivaceomarginata]|nr:hypothetical protein B0H14DRAFT_2629217 [Mycena olivaceomarginata]
MSGGHNASRAPRVRKAPNRIPTTVSDNSNTFTRRMDILFGTDCRDTKGRFHHVRRGPYGMILFAKYLRTIKWATDGIPLTTAALKLSEVAKEMEVLCHHPCPPIGPSPSTASTSGSKRAAGEALSDDEDGPSMKRRNIHQTRNGTVIIEDEDEDEFPPPFPLLQDVCLVLSFVARSPSRASSVELVVPSKLRKNSSGKKSSLSLGDKKTKKKSHVTPPPSGSDPTAVGDDGLLLDIDIAEIAISETLDTTADLKKFFHPATPMVGKAGTIKLHWKCKICPPVDADVKERKQAEAAAKAAAYRGLNTLSLGKYNQALGKYNQLSLGCLYRARHPGKRSGDLRACRGM